MDRLDKSLFADAAGKWTHRLNASFSAYDYKVAKLDSGRSFLMDDYLQSGRVARRRDLSDMPHLGHDSCWEVMRKDDAPDFVAKQGFRETKLHAGFMRRQFERGLTKQGGAACLLKLQQRPLDRRQRRRAHQPVFSADDLAVGRHMPQQGRQVLEIEQGQTLIVGVLEGHRQPCLIGALRG